MGWGMALPVCSSIDWAATGSMLSGWATLFGAGAVVYAAHKGSDTFKQWRRQKNEERRIELAEQILTLAYKLRRAIEGIRSPAMWAEESIAIHDELRKNGVITDQTPEGDKGILATAQATLSRSNANKPLWDALLDTMPTAKAVFGDDVENALNALWKQRGKLVASAQSYARLIHQPDPRSEKEREAQLKRHGKLEGVLWTGGDIWAGEDGNAVDEVADAVNGAVEALEVMLLPIIRSNTPFGTNVETAKVG